MSANIADRVSFRAAAPDDLPRIVELIADDPVAAARTGSFGPAHRAAFDEIEASPNDELIVAVLDGEVIGVAQLTFIPGISRNGTRRLLIEAIRVDQQLRGMRIGELLMEHAHDRGRERGCKLAQLTSDKQRPGAHRFYSRLGYVASHEGFKRPLT